MAQKGLDGNLRTGPVLSQLVLKVVHRLVDIVAVAGAALAAGARHLDTTLSTGSAAEGVLVSITGRQSKLAANAFRFEECWLNYFLLCLKLCRMEVCVSHSNLLKLVRRRLRV